LLNRLGFKRIHRFHFLPNFYSLSHFHIHPQHAAEALT
jgi:hypothetical protein